MAGQSTRDIRRRIQSVRNMQQITKAMEMVSAAKLRQAQVRVLAARPFANKIAEVLGRIVAGQEGGRDGDGSARVQRLVGHHGLLARRELRRVLICAIAADRGLAGGYNANVIRALEAALRRERAEGRKVELVVVGRKLRDWARRAGVAVEHVVADVGDHVEYHLAQEVAHQLVSRYESARVDAVWLIYNQFVSSVLARPVRFQLLPIAEGGPQAWPVGLGGPRGEAAGPGEAAASATGDAGAAGPASTVATQEEPVPYLYHPSADAVVGVLLGRYVDVEVYRAMLEAKASEHGARMAAMRSASDNAEEMIESLTLSFNRARQAGITREISEIVGGAEALISGA